jgi:hypothetical protein
VGRGLLGEAHRLGGLLRPPGVVGHDGDALLHDDDGLDPAAGQHLRLVGHGGDPAADGRRADHGDVLHALDMPIDAVDRHAQHLVGEVRALGRRADVLVLRRVLEGRVLGHGQRGGSLGEAPVGLGAARRGVADAGVPGRQLGLRHTHLLGCGRDEQRPGAGGRLAHAAPAREPDRRAAARHLHGAQVPAEPEGRVQHLLEEATERLVLEDEALDDVAVGEGAVGRGLLHVHGAQRHIELLGHDLLQAGVRALAHLRVGRQQVDGRVRADLDPQRDQRPALGRAPALVLAAVVGAEHGDGGAQADGQPAADGETAHEEGAAIQLHHTVPASTTAWRMRS